MKPNELSIGDWVCYNNHNDYIGKIRAIFWDEDNKSYYVKLDKHIIQGFDNLNPDTCYDVELLSPIPLTKEILEKICDKVDPIEGNIHNYVEYCFGEDILISSEDDYPFMLYFENTPGEHAHVKTEFVHELQHWLRSLKYEKEIEL